MASAKESALLAHIVAQTTANIDFLVAQSYISHADAVTIKSKLPAGDLASSMNNLQISAPSPPAVSIPSVQVPNVYTPPPSAPYSPPIVESHYNTPSPQPPRAVPPPPVKPAVQTARAIWAYNEDGREANDLSFSAGEIVEITEKTNADWWTGRARGKTALFPSNYVELIENGPAYAQPLSEKQPYRPFGAAYHGAVAQPAQAPMAQTPAGLQPDVAEQEKKKNKFGKYGDTLAHSAVGGVGFGAGSAIGSGIVHAIF